MTTSQALAGTYTEEAVHTFAEMDSTARSYTPEWGELSNSWPHSIDGINASGATATDLITISMHDLLCPVEGRLEQLRLAYPVFEEAAFRELDAREQAAMDVDRIRSQAKDENVEVPDQAWRRKVSEIVGFATLGIGDLYFTATAFQVFGLSDKNIGLLPVSELQLAASSVVSAMLLLTWLSGHHARCASHELVRPTKGTPARKWGWVLAAASLFGDLGVLLVLTGLSDVRTSFLSQQGFNAESSAFFSVQVGVAIAGWSLAFWSASPLHQKWRSATHALTKATSASLKACRKATTIAGTYNSAIRERTAMLQRFRAWAEGIRHDVIRKDHLYVAEVRAAFPEPIWDASLPSKLTDPTSSYLVEQIDAFAAGEASILKVYDEISTARIKARLDELDNRRRARHPSSSEKRP